MEYALIASVIINAVLGWALINTNARRLQAETRAYFYQNEVREMTKAFMIAQRNSVQRDPKTGRYIRKKGK